MEMNDEKFNAITSEIFKKTGVFKCPVCGHTEGFDFKPYEYAIVQGEKENNVMTLGGSIMRALVGTCPHCSYMLSFNIDKIEKKLAEEKQSL